VGLGAPIGADFAIGPGRVFLDLTFLYAPFNTNITGSGSVGTFNLADGYRMLF
jgi:hypothetical protein